VPGDRRCSRLPDSPPPSVQLTGNFTWRDEFDGPALPARLELPADTAQALVQLTEHPGALALQPGEASLSDPGNPAFLGHRQQHARFTASTAIRLPVVAGLTAGLAAFQNELPPLLPRSAAAAARDCRSCWSGPPVGITEACRKMVACMDLPAPDLIYLKIEGDGRAYSFSYAIRPSGMEGA